MSDPSGVFQSLDWGFLKDRSFWADALGILSFPITAFALKEARGARLAASEARNEIRRYDFVSEISLCIRDMSTMKSHILEGKHQNLFLLASDVRSRMVRSKSASKKILSEAEMVKIQSAITTIVDIEHASRASIERERNIANRDRVLRILGEKIDDLIEMSEDIKSREEHAQQ